MQLIMQSATVAKISVGLCHRNQIKPVVSLTAFGKLPPQPETPYGLGPMCLAPIQPNPTASLGV